MFWFIGWALILMALIDVARIEVHNRRMREDLARMREILERIEQRSGSPLV